MYCLYVCGVTGQHTESHTRHSAHVEVRRQLLGVSHLLPLWVLGIQFRCSKCYDPLSHRAGPVEATWKWPGDVE